MASKQQEHVTALTEAIASARSRSEAQEQQGDLVGALVLAATIPAYGLGLTHVAMPRTPDWFAGLEAMQDPRPHQLLQRVYALLQAATADLPVSADLQPQLAAEPEAITTPA